LIEKRKDMIEVVYCMRRRKGMTREEFLAHWEQVHAPIVMRNLSVLRLARYERIVPVSHPYSARVERRRTMQEPYDGIARLGWASQEDLRHAFESDEALPVQRALAEDERRFVDESASCRWIASAQAHL
jgi:uncharacterized protein (TIGR02118 family)